MTFLLAAIPFWISALALLYGPVFALMFRANSTVDLESLLGKTIYRVPRSFQTEDEEPIGELRDLSFELTSERLLAIAARAGESSAIAASTLSLAVTLITNSAIRLEFGDLAIYASIVALLAGFLASGYIVTMQIDRYTARKKIGPFARSTAWLFVAYLALGIGVGFSVTF